MANASRDAFDELIFVVSGIICIVGFALLVAVEYISYVQRCRLAAWAAGGSMDMTTGRRGRTFLCSFAIGYLYENLNGLLLVLQAT